MLHLQWSVIRPPLEAAEEKEEREPPTASLFPFAINLKLVQGAHMQRRSVKINARNVTIMSP